MWSNFAPHDNFGKIDKYDVCRQHQKDPLTLSLELRTICRRCTECEFQKGSSHDPTCRMLGKKSDVGWVGAKKGKAREKVRGLEKKRAGEAE